MNEYDLDILKLKNKGYCCSQIVMHLALNVHGTSNPGLIRALSGICRGFLSARGACGALTGAACIIGSYAGKGKDDEEAHEQLPQMLSELGRWFEEYAVPRFGGINCADIVSDFKPDMAICGGLIAECFGRAMTILMDNGFDPASPPHD
jgi:hypothetical protein